MGKKIRTAIVGVGNCAKSLVEGVAYYTKNSEDEFGLMHPLIGGFHTSEIKFVAAFDIDKRKVGYKLHESIIAKPNNTIAIADPLEYDCRVERGPTLDSIGNDFNESLIIESNDPECNIIEKLNYAEAEIVLNYLPSGSDKAAYAYAEAALEANCHFINCMSTPLAKDKILRKRFEEKELILIGDDIKSQLGATIINHSLLRLLKMRGAKVTLSKQVNQGGNADHFNLHFRHDDKEEVKLAPLINCLNKTDTKPEVFMEYVETNYDHKISQISIKGEIFGRIPWSIDLTINNEDSPNSSGVVVDAIRIAKLLADKKKHEFSKDICSFLMKFPPVQYSEDEGYRVFNKIIHELSL